MIPKTSEPYFLPDLFYGVHFRRIWRNEEQADIISAVFHTAQMPSMCSILRHSTVETLTAIRELKACDVNIIFESENIDTLAVDSEVLITIISAYAQAENDSRSDNVTWGIKKRAADGTSGLYRRRCYGYTNDESGELAIVPAEAEVVHFIFESYLNGASLMKIRTALEERGTLSPHRQVEMV